MFQAATRRSRRALKEAEGALTRGDHAVAMAAYERAFDQATHRAAAAEGARPDLAAQAQIGLGRIRLRTGQGDIATLHFARAMTLQPQDPAARYWAACADAHCGRHPTAEARFTDVLARLPGEPRALVQRAHVRILQRRTAAARADLTAAFSRPGAPGSRLLTAVLDLQAGEWSAAQDLLADDDQAPASVGGLGTRHRLLAFAHEGTRQQAEALRHYEKSLALDGEATPEGALYRSGDLAYRLGRFDDCTRLWRLLLERRPDDPRVHHLVDASLHAAAWEQLSRKDFAGALRRLEATDAPADALLELHLHLAADERSTPADAREHLRAAGALSPTDPRVLHHLGLLEYQHDDPRQAGALWRRLLRARPEALRTRYALALTSGDAAAGELAAVLEAADREEEPELASAAATSLAALRIRGGDWAGAAEILLPYPGAPARDVLLAESLYRSGNPTRAPASALGPWRSLQDSDDPRVRREHQLLDRASRLTSALDSAEVPSGDAALSPADWASMAEQLSAADADGSAPRLESAVLLHLGGRSEAARRELLRLWRADPTDARTARTLGLTLLGALHAQALPHIGSAWRQCLAAWGLVLEDRDGWQEFLGDAERRYGQPVPAPERAAVAGELREYLAGRLPDSEDRGIPLRLLFRREAEAAAFLARRGSFRVEGRPLACGPLALHELGVGKRFRRSVASWEGRFGSRDFDDLLLYFSGLGIAAAQAESGDRAEALLTLGDLRCPACSGPSAERTGGASLDDVLRTWSERTSPLSCASDCPGFAELHPAYAALQDGRTRLTADALAQVRGILLDLGTDALRQRPPDVAGARRPWALALDLAGGPGPRRAAGERIAHAATGRANALLRSRSADPGLAIDVLRLALDLLGSHGPTEQVRSLLAHTLNQRGVQGANTLLQDRSLAPSTIAARLEAHVADLRRATELNPHSSLFRVNLGKLLHTQVGVALQAGDFGALLQKQAESSEYAAKLHRDFPGSRAVTELSQEVSGVDDMLTEALLRRPGPPSYGRR